MHGRGHESACASRDVEEVDGEDRGEVDGRFYRIARGEGGTFAHMKHGSSFAIKYSQDDSAYNYSRA